MTPAVLAIRPGPAQPLDRASDGRRGMTAVFRRIYQGNLWNGVESRSGPGSGPAATSKVAAELLALAAELNVASVLDVACGDGYWMPTLPGYVGIDVAPEAVELARRNHPERQYMIGNAITMRLPRFDLVIVRDAIQHLPLASGQALLHSIRLSGSQWLLASTYVGGENLDVEFGGAFSPDLSAAPFDLGPPLRLLFDGYHYHEHGTDALRDGRKHLGLWPL